MLRIFRVRNDVNRYQYFLAADNDSPDRPYCTLRPR
jgi:hypothetical protein